jgi:hypothetical protein
MLMLHELEARRVLFTRSIMKRLAVFGFILVCAVTVLVIFGERASAPVDQASRLFVRQGTSQVFLGDELQAVRSDLQQLHVPLAYLADRSSYPRVSAPVSADEPGIISSSSLHPLHISDATKRIFVALLCDACTNQILALLDSASDPLNVFIGIATSQTQLSETHRAIEARCLASKSAVCASDQLRYRVVERKSGFGNVLVMRRDEDLVLLLDADDVQPVQQWDDLLRSALGRTRAKRLRAVISEVPGTSANAICDVDFASASHQAGLPTPITVSTNTSRGVVLSPFASATMVFGVYREVVASWQSPRIKGASLTTWAASLALAKQGTQVVYPAGRIVKYSVNQAGNATLQDYAEIRQHLTVSQSVRGKEALWMRRFLSGLLLNIPEQKDLHSQAIRRCRNVPV